MVCPRSIHKTCGEGLHWYRSPIPACQTLGQMHTHTDQWAAQVYTECKCTVCGWHKPSVSEHPPATAHHASDCLQAVQLVKQATFQQVSLGLLYHISQEDRHKTMFIYTDAVTVMLDLLMRVDDLTTTPELIALAVNLTQNDRIAEVTSVVRPASAA